MMKGVLAFLASFCLVFALYSQTEEHRFRFRGQIIDTRSKNALNEFPVKVKEYNRIVYTNDKGEFLFNMPENTYTLIFDDYPYIRKEIVINLTSDTTLVVTMDSPEGVRNLQEVQVVASRKFVQQPAGITKISSNDLISLPTMIGERDLLKVLSLNAGVSSSSDGAADIQVRGGQHGHNLFLLDNVPLYSTQHMYGMVSVFNPSIIKSAELFKGGFPAEYGGRIASVVHVRSKDPDLDKFSGEAEISLLSTKASLNLPVIKEKLAVTLAARISNYSLLSLFSLTGLSEQNKIGLHFADLNCGVLFKPGEKDIFKFSLFYNSDGISLSQKEYNIISETTQHNSQINYNFNWQKKISNSVSNYFQIYTDAYRFKYCAGSKIMSTNEREIYQVNSSVVSGSIENKLTIKFSDSFSTDAGLSLKSFSFSPYELSFTDTSLVSESIPNSQQFEGDISIQSGYSINENHLLDAGVRLTSYGNSEKYYSSFEPRLSYHGIINDEFSVSASMAKMSQNIHRVANPGLGVPMELFHSSDMTLLPEESWMYSIGTSMDKKWGQRALSVRADFWYKQMRNLVDYMDGYDAISMLISSNFIPDSKANYLTQGIGKALGVDISANFTIPKFKLTADYTLMEAIYQFDELNNGQWFAASTDIRHSISLTGEIKLKKNWTLTASWQYRSGRPFTLPTAVYPVTELDFNAGSITFLNKVYVHNQPFQTVETIRNNARMKPFHRADIAFNHTYLLKNKYKALLSFGLFNLYNRANPSYYFIGYELVDKNYYPVLKSFSMLPILPSISWSVKF